jgi:hypothetical protein
LPADAKPTFEGKFMIYDHSFADALVPLGHERRYRVRAGSLGALQQTTQNYHRTDCACGNVRIGAKLAPAEVGSATCPVI